MSKDVDTYLEALAHDELYVVDAVLKETEYERTERVFLPGAEGEPDQGPFIRKYFSSDSGMGGEYERIWRAQQAGVRFDHLPRVYECADLGEWRVVVMEFIKGRTLEEVVKDRGASVELAADIFPLLCESVRELHERFNPPIVHRDLKPSNIMVCEDRLFVIDLGIARTFKEDAEEDTQHFGTRNYAPPEQFGFGQTDVRSDVYAMGALLYYLLTGEAPSSQARDARFAHKKVPESLRQVISCACAFDPSARFDSVEQMQDAFESALEVCVPRSSGPTMHSGATFGAEKEWGEKVRAAAAQPQGQPKAGTSAGAHVQAQKQARPASKKRTSRSSEDGYVSGVPQEEAGPSLASRIGDFFSRHAPPFAVGVVWDVFLIIVLATLFFVCIVCIVDPSGGVASWPLSERIISYLSMFFLLFCPITFAIRDRRVGKKLLPNIKRLSTGTEIALCVVLVILYFVLFVIVAIAYA